jgi:DNA-binding CsgD family transcriptional regulator
MKELRKLLDYLEFYPNVGEIARMLIVEDIFSEKATAIRICLLNSDDSLLTIGEYGYVDRLIDTTISSDIWRKSLSSSLHIVELIQSGLWNKEFTEFLFILRNRGSLQGYITVNFDFPISNKVESQESIESICQLVGIFLNGVSAFKPKEELKNARNNHGDWDATKTVLSQRQLLILVGMIEGKTNHELAEDLGFSVSTIRHETMRIYSLLRVSDRKEAAREAVLQSLV